MLLDQAALCEQAAMFESMELQESKFHPSFMSELEKLLLEVYASLLPSASEYEQRKQLVQAFNMTAKKTFGDSGGFRDVVAFGSFIMNIFTAKSDLDLSINFNSSNAARLPRVQVVSVLRRFTKVLREERSKGNLSGVSLVQYAKVPVLKAVDCKTGIECDISVENKDGISRSLFYSIIFSIDERFRIMSYLMKAWAKANGINSSRHHTMNSISIISLVALHFQTRDPPILPPFSTLLKDDTDFTDLPDAVLELTKSAKRNNESVAELFVSLLAKLTSVENLWELGLCASNFEGSWISKTWTSKSPSSMNVEDFLDRTQNFARSVGKSKMPKIYDCLRMTLGYLSSSMLGQIGMPVLRTLLFESTSLHTQNSLANTIRKLPIRSIQPRVDFVNQNHAGSIAGTRLKRKETSKKSACIETGVDGNNHARLGKRPRRNTNAYGAFSLGSRDNRSYIPPPTLTIHPAPAYFQPLNGFGHSNISGYHPPVPSNMGHGLQQIQYPFTNPPTSSLQYLTMVQEPSGIFQYFPNSVHHASLGVGHPSMLPGYPMHYSNNAGHIQYVVPPRRSFGSNHPGFY